MVGGSPSISLSLFSSLLFSLSSRPVVLGESTWWEGPRASLSLSLSLSLSSRLVVLGKGTWWEGPRASLSLFSSLSASPSPLSSLPPPGPHGHGSSLPGVLLTQCLFPVVFFSQICFRRRCSTRWCHVRIAAAAPDPGIPRPTDLLAQPSAQTPFLFGSHHHSALLCFANHGPCLDEIFIIVASIQALRSGSINMPRILDLDLISTACLGDPCAM